MTLYTAAVCFSCLCAGAVVPAGEDSVSSQGTFGSIWRMSRLEAWSVVEEMASGDASKFPAVYRRVHTEDPAHESLAYRDRPLVRMEGGSLALQQKWVFSLGFKNVRSTTIPNILS